MAGKKGRKKAPAKRREDEALKKWRQEQWQKDLASKERVKKKRLSRGIEPQKIIELQERFGFDPLLLREEGEIMAVASLPITQKQERLQSLLRSKHQFKRVAAGQGEKLAFSPLIRSVMEILERQKGRFSDLAAKTKGTSFEKRWRKRLQAVERKLAKAESFLRRVEEAGGRRQSVIRKVKESKSLWAGFAKEAQNLFEFELGREMKPHFERQLAKLGLDPKE